MSNSLKTYKRSIVYLTDISSLYNYIIKAAPNLDVSQLLRWQYAFIISCFDKYLHDLVREKFVAKFFSCSLSPKNPVSFSSFQIQNIICANNTIDRELLIDGYLQQMNAKSSFQAPRNVEYALSLIEVNKVWSALSPIMGFTAEDISAKLAIIVNRRNKIVHESDIDQPTGMLTQIDDEMVTNCYIFIDQLVNAIESIV